MKQDRKKRSRVSKLTDTNTPFARLLLVPSLAGVLVFFIIPFMIVIWYSFLDNPINKDFVFLRNYQVLFKNNAFITAAKNTLILSAVAVPLAVCCRWVWQACWIPRYREKVCSEHFSSAP